MALDPLTAGMDLAGKVLDKIFPDPEARAQAQIRLVEIQQSGELAQIAVNQEEAKSDNLFVSGWRPFIGWVCGVAFAYHFILQPVILFIAAFNGHTVALINFDMETLTTVLMGMLGLGGLRTLEKVATRGALPWQK